MNNFLLASQPLQIVYTGNINCALDDCHCSNELVGGLTRVAYIVDSLKQSPVPTLVVDAGDYLASYSVPAANYTLLQVMGMMRYDHLNIGDQEFVEGEIFFRSLVQQLMLPVGISNFAEANGTETLSCPPKIWQNGEWKVLLIPVLDPRSFEFIPFPRSRLMPPEEYLKQLSNTNFRDTRLQLLLFHGRWETALRLVKDFPWIDVVVLAHSQRKEYRNIEGRAVMVEPGTSGEYVGLLKIVHHQGQLRFSNQFLPITRKVPIQTDIRDKVQEFYHSLKKE